jgi:predicted DNA-binding transcriptional regulator AlpA
MSSSRSTQDTAPLVDPRRLLNLRTFCQRYDVSERTVHRLYKEGKGPPEIHLAGSKKIHFDPDDAHAWALSWRTAPAAPAPPPPRNPGRPRSADRAIARLILWSAMPPIPCKRRAIGTLELCLARQVSDVPRKSHAAAKLFNRNNALTPDQRDHVVREVSSRGAPGGARALR